MVFEDDVRREVEVNAKSSDYVAIFGIIVGNIVVAHVKALILVTCKVMKTSNYFN